MEELKPCPFCGSEAEIRNEKALSADGYAIGCKRCMVYMYDGIKSRAVEKWNRRVK